MDPADEYDRDAKRFMAKFRKFAEVNFGKRCPEFDGECHTCKLWQLHDDVSEVVLGECGDGPGIHRTKRK